jgi:hypothetical protein
MEEVIEAGYTEDKVVFIYQNHGFMTKKLFQYWAQRIFFPYVAEKRLQMKYSGNTILLMDQFSGHQYAEFEEDCRIHRVQTRPLIPHTSHLSQPLDQIIFSVFKQRFGGIHVNRFVTSSSNRIIRILRAWYQTISADLITSTFTGAGIVPDKVLYGSVMSCRVDLERSIHMKYMLPEELSAGTEEEDKEKTSKETPMNHYQSHSAPMSPKKIPHKGHKIVKIEEPTQMKQPSSMLPSAKQLTIEDLFPKKFDPTQELPSKK